MSYAYWVIRSRDRVGFKYATEGYGRTAHFSRRADRAYLFHVKADADKHCAALFEKWWPGQWSVVARVEAPSRKRMEAGASVDS